MPYRLLIIFFCILKMSHLSSAINVGWGQRYDDFSWSIAGPDKEPNVLSELVWKDLRTSIFSCQLRSLVPFTNFYFRLSGDYGWIQSGKNRDSDFQGNDKTLEFSRSINKAGRGKVWDYQTSIGRVYSAGGCLSIAYLGGYSHHEQHLRMYDGKQVINTINPDFIGPFEGLNSTYKAVWEGPWVGVDLIYNITSNVSCFASYEKHYAEFRGVGNWNLREDFLSDFHQKADGRGRLYLGEISYRFCGNWSLGLGAEYQKWKTKHGKEKQVIEIDLDDNGIQIPLLIEAPFNGAKWKAWRVYLSLSLY